MKVTCVVADDDASIRSMWGDWLSLIRDVEVVGEAATEDEAVSCILSLSPTFAMLDRSMPPGDGIVAITRVREAGYEGPCVLVSGGSMGESVALEGLEGVYFAPKAQGPAGLAAFLDQMGF